MALLTIEDVVAPFAEIDRNSLKEVVTRAKNSDYRAVREGLVRYILDRLPKPPNIGTVTDQALRELGTHLRSSDYRAALEAWGKLPETGMDDDATEFCADIMITAGYMISPERASQSLTHSLGALYGSDRALGAIGIGMHNISEKGERLLNEDPTGLLLLSKLFEISGDDLPRSGMSRGVKFFSDTYTRLLNEVTAQN